MGFGSYDESEQQNREVDADDGGGVSVRSEGHGGEVTFESEESTDDLVDRLKDIKADADE